MIQERPIFLFSEMAIEDIPQLHVWLNRKHVAEWWDDRLSITQVTEDFTEFIQSTNVFPHLVYLEGKAIGYIQKYDAFRSKEGGWWPDEPEGTWGVDQFIAEESLLGKGLGSKFVKEFTDQLLRDSHVTRVITDPSPRNGRAIRAYEKAGFKIIRQTITPGGPATILEKSIVKT